METITELTMMAELTSEMKKQEDTKLSVATIMEEMMEDTMEATEVASEEVMVVVEVTVVVAVESDLSSSSFPYNFNISCIKYLETVLISY